MARAKAAAVPSTDVTIPRTILEQFVSLMEGLEAADSAYKSCQSTLFRNFAHSAYRAANMQTAYEDAKAALESK